ncbi:MAG: protein phosphatase 2C domain-containing protein, partial [Bacteroidota bacterium]
MEASPLTDVGNVRTLNEDSVAVVCQNDCGGTDKGTLLILADGLGGYNAGEVASGLVTTKVPELYFDGHGEDYLSDLTSAITSCNEMVYEASRLSEELRGMGSTLVTALVVNQFAVFANVGDSRGYIFRDGSVYHRTKDHSLKDATLDVPGFAGRSRFSHVLTRAVGPKPTVLIDVTTHRIAAGDIVVLCSDGLSDYVADDELGEIVAK